VRFLPLSLPPQMGDPEDQGRLYVTWEADKGRLANTTDTFRAIWTAPDYPGMANINVRITDPQGAWGAFKLKVIVGITEPSPSEAVLKTWQNFAGAINDDGSKAVTEQFWGTFDGVGLTFQAIFGKICGNPWCSPLKLT